MNRRMMGRLDNADVKDVIPCGNTVQNFLSNEEIAVKMLIISPELEQTG